VKSVYENRDQFNLNAEEKMLLDEMYKDFVRSGANLSDADKGETEGNQRGTFIVIGKVWAEPVGGDQTVSNLLSKMKRTFPAFLKV
jgi:hypothetical protein